jgi:hypothetical protein
MDDDNAFQGDAMRRKSIGWIILSGCVIAVAVAVFSGLQQMPERAQAAVAPPQQANVVPAETTQDCQAVAAQIVAIQQTILAEKRSGQLKGLAPLDVLVAQEYQIDTSKCPADFRMAVLHFVAAEDVARIHAHMDRTGRLGEALTACVEVAASRGLAIGKATQSWNAYNQKITDEQKQDLANIQSALLDFAQVAMKYGVK